MKKSIIVIKYLIITGALITVEFGAAQPVVYADDAPVQSINQPYSITKMDSAHAYLSYEGVNQPEELTYDGRSYDVCFDVSLRNYKDTSSISYFDFQSGIDYQIVDVQGPNVKKILVQDAHDETYNYYSNEDGRMNAPESTAMSNSTLIKLANVVKRLGVARFDYFDIMSPEYYAKETYSLEQLRQFKNAREYIKASGFMQDDALYIDYLGTKESILNLQIAADNHYDLEKTLVALRNSDGAARYITVPSVIWYPDIYVKDTSEKISVLQSSFDQMKQKYPNTKMTLIHKDGNYILQTNIMKASENAKNDATSQMQWEQHAITTAANMGLNYGDYTYQVDSGTENTYSLQWDFTDRQLTNAWADEMDTWWGHWDFFVNGERNFKYYPNETERSEPYTHGGTSWSEGRHALYDQMTVHYDAQYKFQISEPGTYTVTAKGYRILKDTVTASFTIKSAAGTPMYRLYNPNSGEHFYTKDANERVHLVSLGWKNEGVGWTAPFRSSTPVYRLYNPNAGEHHYTCDGSEKNHLVSVGWNDEGVGWYSDDQKSVPLYRQYNPNAFSCNHNYTINKDENDWLTSLGWQAEGIGWYGAN